MSPWTRRGGAVGALGARAPHLGSRARPSVRAGSVVLSKQHALRPVRFSTAKLCLTRAVTLVYTVPLWRPGPQSSYHLEPCLPRWPREGERKGRVGS